MTNKFKYYKKDSTDEQNQIFLEISEIISQIKRTLLKVLLKNRNSTDDQILIFLGKK